MKYLTHLQIDYYSNALSRGTHLEALLPEGSAPEEGFPTLYLLHGMTDDFSLWMRRTAIERYAQERNMAVIMPGGDLGWYTDTAAGERYFEHIAVEAVEFSRRLLPQLSRRRLDSFVAGNSMGGYGALRCALCRPETFFAAASLSGALDAAALPALDPPLAGADYWRDIFGPAEEIPGSPHDLFYAARHCAAPRPRIWMWCGTQDFLYPASVRMRDHLRALGYALSYHESTGDHQWKYWDREIARAMDWFLAERGAAACP